MKLFKEFVNNLASAGAEIVQPHKSLCIAVSVTILSPVCALIWLPRVASTLKVTLLKVKAPDTIHVPSDGQCVGHSFCSKYAGIDPGRYAAKLRRTTGRAHPRRRALPAARAGRPAGAGGNDTAGAAGAVALSWAASAAAGFAGGGCAREKLERAQPIY